MADLTPLSPPKGGKLLYGRVCTIELAGKQIIYSDEMPYSFEFSKEFKKGKPSVTKVKIYNPNNDTIKLCEKTGTNFPECQITAGYRDYNGLCVLGEVVEYKVEYKKPDRTLEMTVADKTSKWANAIVAQTYQKQSVQAIIRDLCKKIGLKIDSMNVDDVQVDAFTADTFQASIERLLKKTDAKFYFNDGRIVIEKIGTNNQRNVVYLSETTGLLGSPQKKSEQKEEGKGKVKKKVTRVSYNIKSLFLYEIGCGSIIKVNSTELKDTDLVVEEGKHNFSTFGQATTEMECVVSG